MIRNVLPVASAALLGALWCSGAPAETLAGAVMRAVVNFPEVKIAVANQRAIEENAVQARSAWFPTLDASAGQGKQTSDNVTTRILGSDQTLTRTEAQISLSQLLFDGGVTSGQVKRFESRALAASDQVVNAAENAALRTSVAYLDVLRLRGIIGLATDNVRRHEETLKQVALLADSGRGRRADQQQAEARLALAQSSLTQLRVQLAAAEAAYRHLVGQPPGTLASPGEFAEKLPSALGDALKTALETHPSIRAAQKDLEAAQGDRESASGRVWSPRLSLEAGGSKNHDLDGLRGLNADRYAMLRLRYNLLRGGADVSREREAAARIDEAYGNVSRTRNDVERDLRQSWDGLMEDRARLPELGRYVASSNDVVIAYRAQFSIGQRTLLDVLNSENELYTAKSTLYTGLWAVTAGELRVISAMGRLLDTLGVPVTPPESEQAQAEKP